MIVLVAVGAGGWWWMTRDSGGPDKADADTALNDVPEFITPSRQPEPELTIRNPQRQPEQAPPIVTEPSVTIATGEGVRTPEAATNAGGSRLETESGLTDPSTPRRAAPDLSGTVQQIVTRADEAIRRNDLPSARSLLNAALKSPAATSSDRRELRQRLTELNQELVFSPRVVDGDPLASAYEIQSGDSLQKIASRTGLAIDWRFLARINRIADPRRIRVGQRIKLVRGPFHAVVDRSDYRLDLYAGNPHDREHWTFIASYPVGLGEANSTPAGEFEVRADSKLINPTWWNPRTGERFDADDPENPIGERWIGLDGVDASSVHTGLGIHGTIEPDSIGKQMSMGCVRMLDDDVQVVYELLEERISQVYIED